jgi:hypothetical protein
LASGDIVARLQPLMLYFDGYECLSPKFDDVYASGQVVLKTPELVGKDRVHFSVNVARFATHIAWSAGTRGSIP